MMSDHTASCGSASILTARLLETVVLVFKSGEEMVIHAMPAGRQFWELLP